jgi:hypothetical protein
MPEPIRSQLLDLLPTLANEQKEGGLELTRAQGKRTVVYADVRLFNPHSIVRSLRMIQYPIIAAPSYHNTHRRVESRGATSRAFRSQPI